MSITSHKSVNSANRKLSRSRSAKSIKSIGSSSGNAKTSDILDKIIYEDETHSFILSIRDEIMENALNKCYENYINKTAIKFVVHCVQKAWSQLFGMEMLFHHNSDDYRSDPSFLPAQVPEPSPQDTWANHSIPISDEPKETLVSQLESEVPDVINQTYDVNKDEDVLDAKVVSLSSPKRVSTPGIVHIEKDVEIEQLCDEEVDARISTDLSIFNGPVDEEQKPEGYAIAPKSSFFTTCVESHCNELPKIAWNWKNETPLTYSKTSYISPKTIKSFSNKIGDNSNLPPIRLCSTIFTGLDKKQNSNKLKHTQSLDAEQNREQNED